MNMVLNPVVAIGLAIFLFGTAVGGVRMSSTPSSTSMESSSSSKSSTTSKPGVTRSSSSGSTTPTNWADPFANGQQGNPGARGLVCKKSLDAVHEWAADTMGKAMKATHLPEWTTNIPGHGSLTIKPPRVTQADYAKFRYDMTPPSSVDTQLLDGQFTGEGVWQFKPINNNRDPMGGTYKAQIRQSQLNATNRLTRANDGRPMVVVQKCQANMSNFRAEIQGASRDKVLILSRAVTPAKPGNNESFIVESCDTELCKMILKHFETEVCRLWEGFVKEVINKELQQIPTKVAVNGDQYRVDYSLLKDPTVNDTSMCIQVGMEGKYLWRNSNGALFSPASMEWTNRDQMYSFHLSDFAINSMFHQAHQGGHRFSAYDTMCSSESSSSSSSSISSSSSDEHCEMLSMDCDQSGSASSPNVRKLRSAPTSKSSSTSSSTTSPTSKSSTTKTSPTTKTSTTKSSTTKTSTTKTSPTSKSTTTKSSTKTSPTSKSTRTTTPKTSPTSKSTRTSTPKTSPTTKSTRSTTPRTSPTTKSTTSKSSTKTSPTTTSPTTSSSTTPKTSSTTRDSRKPRALANVPKCLGSLMANFANFGGPHESNNTGDIVWKTSRGAAVFIDSDKSGFFDASDNGQLEFYGAARGNGQRPLLARVDVQSMRGQFMPKLNKANITGLIKLDSLELAQPSNLRSSSEMSPEWLEAAAKFSKPLIERALNMFLGRFAQFAAPLPSKYECVSPSMSVHPRTIQMDCDVRRIDCDTQTACRCFRDACVCSEPCDPPKVSKGFKKNVKGFKRH